MSWDDIPSCWVRDGGSDVGVRETRMARARARLQEAGRGRERAYRCEFETVSYVRVMEMQREG